MPEYVIGVIAVICVITACIASLSILRLVLQRKDERRVTDVGDGLRERLDRIEQAVETTALEVERISEANRFMSKLLSDRGGAVNPASRPERVITPQ